MRRVSIDKISPGTILAKTIIANDGTNLLTGGLKLSNKHLEKIHKIGITDIYIEDDISKNIQEDEFVSEKIIQDTKKCIKELMSSPNIKISMKSRKVNELVTKIVNNILSKEVIIFNLSQIRSVDDYTFEHSVNVCIVALIIGAGLGFSEGQMNELGIGALLHDIGKIFIPEEILKKPGALSEEEYKKIKDHTIMGYEVLRKIEGVSISAAYISLGHHERVDSSGYPYGLCEISIKQLAKIVAVADVFDALTSDRIYRKKLMPHEVVEYIISLKDHHFDQYIVDAFIKHVAHYSVGTTIVLNTNEKAIVIRQNPKDLLHPVVRIITDEMGDYSECKREIDLSRSLDYNIAGYWDI